MATKTRTLTIGLTTMILMIYKRSTEPNLFSQVRRPLPTNLATPTTGANKTDMSTSYPDTSYQEETPLLGRTPSISDLQKESYLRQKLKKAVDTIKD